MSTTTEPRTVIAKGWLVCFLDAECCDIADAATRSKAKWATRGDLWEDMDELISPNWSIRRRKDLDGLTLDQAYDVVWPCTCDDEERARPCPKHEWL